MDSPGASALKSREEQGPKAPCPQECMGRFIFQPTGCKDSLEITAGLSLGKSLSLNTFSLDLKDDTCSSQAFTH